MVKFLRISGILLAAAAICCFGICIFEEGQNRLLLSIGLLCNSLALFLCVFTGKRR